MPHWRADSFRGWLFAVARNAAADRHKRRRLPTAYDDVILLHADPRRASEPDTLSELARCLGRLSPECRAALEGVFAGQSYDEVVADLGLPAGTVKSRVSRGRAALRTCLGPYAE